MQLQCPSFFGERLREENLDGLRWCLVVWVLNLVWDGLKSSGGWQVAVTFHSVTWRRQSSSKAGDDQTKQHTFWLLLFSFSCCGNLAILSRKKVYPAKQLGGTPKSIISPGPFLVRHRRRHDLFRMFRSHRANPEEGWMIYFYIYIHTHINIYIYECMYLHIYTYIDIATCMYIIKIIWGIAILGDFLNIIEGLEGIRMHCPKCGTVCCSAFLADCQVDGVSNLVSTLMIFWQPSKNGVSVHILGKYRPHHNSATTWLEMTVSKGSYPKNAQPFRLTNKFSLGIYPTHC